MNSLVRLPVAARAAVAVTIAAGFVAGAAGTDGLPLVHIPILPAGFSGGLLITLGFILGRATRPNAAPAPSRSTAQVTATVVRSVDYGRPLPDAAVVMLPLSRRSGGDVA